jgi:hypothetical protein
MPRRTFPSFEKLIAATAEVARLLDRPVALGGGLAMQFHGSPRLTGDVDLLANGVGSLVCDSVLAFGGVRGRAPNGVPVEVIVRDDEWTALYGDALVTSVAVDESPVPVVTAEHLVPMKMVTRRPKDDSDVLFLLASGGLDVALTERIVRRHLGAFGVAELKSLLQQAEWLRERER